MVQHKQSTNYKLIILRGQSKRYPEVLYRKMKTFIMKSNVFKHEASNKLMAVILEIVMKL